jgi:hypothetical protein
MPSSRRDRTSPGATEQQRIVCAQRHRDAGHAQGAQRDVGDGRVDPEPDVGGGADLEGHAGGRQPVQQGRVLGRADAVADPPGAQRVEAGGHVARPAQLAAVRRRDQPGPVGDPEGRGEVLGPPPPFVVGQPEADHASAGVLRGQPGQRPGVQRVPGPVRRDDHPDADAGRPGCRRRGVEDHLDGGGQPTQPRRVRRGVHLDLQPAGALGAVVLGRLEHQPVHVARTADHRSGRVVQPLEPEPAALVGRPQLGRVGAVHLGQDVRQPDPVLGGQLAQCRRPQRPGEVQVQVGLRQRAQVPRGAQCASASSWCRRVTPSTRSSSPRA